MTDPLVSALNRLAELSAPPTLDQFMADSMMFKYSPQPINEPWFLRELADKIYKDAGHTSEGQQCVNRIRRIANMLKATTDDTARMDWLCETFGMTRESIDEARRP